MDQQFHEARQRWLFRVKVLPNKVRRVTTMKKFFSMFLVAMFLFVGCVGVSVIGCGSPVNKGAVPTPPPAEHEAEAEATAEHDA